MAVDYEIEILSFLYCFVKYSDIKENTYFECYGLLLNILKHYEETKTPATLLWIVDFVDLLFSKIKFIGSVT